MDGGEVWTAALVDLADSVDNAIAHPEPLLREAGAAGRTPQLAQATCPSGRPRTRRPRCRRPRGRCPRAAGRACARAAARSATPCATSARRHLGSGAGSRTRPGSVRSRGSVVSRPRNHFASANGTPTVIENSSADVGSGLGRAPERAGRGVGVLVVLGGAVRVRRTRRGRSSGGRRSGPRSAR